MTGNFTHPFDLCREGQNFERARQELISQEGFGGPEELASLSLCPSYACGIECQSLFDVPDDGVLHQLRMVRDVIQTIADERERPQHLKRLVCANKSWMVFLDHAAVAFENLQVRLKG